MSLWSSVGTVVPFTKMLWLFPLFIVLCHRKCLTPPAVQGVSGGGIQTVEDEQPNCMDLTPFLWKWTLFINLLTPLCEAICKPTYLLLIIMNWIPSSLPSSPTPFLPSSLPSIINYIFTSSCPIFPPFKFFVLLWHLLSVCRVNVERRLVLPGVLVPPLPHPPGRAGLRHLLLLQDQRPLGGLPGEPGPQGLHPSGAQLWVQLHFQILTRDFH